MLYAMQQRKSMIFFYCQFKIYCNDVELEIAETLMNTTVSGDDGVLYILCADVFAV